MGFVSLRDPGLVICATHRLMAMPHRFRIGSFLEALSRWFDVAPVTTHLSEAVASASTCAIGIAVHGHGHYLATLRDIDRTTLIGGDRGPAWRDLDVAVLHRGIVERIMLLPAETPFVYERDASKALKAVKQGTHGIAFLLRATRSEQIRACAEAGEPMPHKSTYFFPKLPSGAVIYRHV